MSCFSKSVDDLEVESLYARVVRNPRESPPGLGEHGQLEFESHRDREDEVSSSTPTRWDTHKLSVEYEGELLSSSDLPGHGNCSSLDTESA